MTFKTHGNKLIYIYLQQWQPTLHNVLCLLIGSELFLTFVSNLCLFIGSEVLFTFLLLCLKLNALFPVRFLAFFSSKSHCFFNSRANSQSFFICSSFSFALKTNNPILKCRDIQKQLLVTCQLLLLLYDLF